MTASIGLLSIALVYVVQQLQNQVDKKCVVILIIASLLINALACVKRLRYVFPGMLVSSHTYLIKNYPMYPAISFINDSLAANTSVMAFFCFGSYYIDKHYECSDRNFSSSEEMIAHLRDRGFTHIFVNKPAPKGTHNSLWQERAGLRRVFMQNDFFVYEIPQT